MARLIHYEADLAAPLIGLCFGSLVVRKLVQDIDSQAAPSHPPSVADLSYLASILGKTSQEVANLFGLGAVAFANIVSLMSGLSEMDTLVEGVPLEVLDIFRMTLHILLPEQVPLLALRDAELPPDLVVVFHETYSNVLRLKPPDWLVSQLGRISEVLSEARDEPDVLGLPETEPGLGSSTNTSDIS